MARDSLFGGQLIETQGIDSITGDRDYDDGEQDLDDEAQRIMRSWDRNNVMKEIDDEEAAEKDRNSDYTLYYDGCQSFDDLKKDMEKLPGGFVHVKKVEANLNGKEILASHTILFDRIGFFEYDPIPWESSICDGKPTLINLASDPIISGLLQAILTLRQGERAAVLIHPKMAFGALGSPPQIPPNAYIYYSVKIHKVWEEGDFTGMIQYERSLSVIVPLADKLELANEYKNTANQYLAEDQPREALVRYKAAIQWISESTEEEREASHECKELMKILWRNTAITLNRLGMHKSATKAAKQALCIDPRNVKAIYQLAKARMALGDHSRALAALNRGLTVDPESLGLRSLRAQIDSRLVDERKKRDEIMLKMSKALPK